MAHTLLTLTEHALEMQAAVGDAAETLAWCLVAMAAVGLVRAGANALLWTGFHA